MGEINFEGRSSCPARLLTIRRGPPPPAPASWEPPEARLQAKPHPRHRRVMGAAMIATTRGSSRRRPRCCRRRSPPRVQETPPLLWRCGSPLRKRRQVMMKRQEPRPARVRLMLSLLQPSLALRSRKYRANPSADADAAVAAL